MSKRKRRKEQSETQPVKQPSRRTFTSQAAAIGIGAVATLAPVVAGLVTILSPLSRTKKADGSEVEWTRVGSLDDLPADGVPRPFSVMKERTDAWTHYPRDVVGTVLLRRDKQTDEVLALSNICPHLGCMVSPNEEGTQIDCPCHNSSFTNEGIIADPNNTVSPRDLDRLEVKREGDSILVRF